MKEIIKVLEPEYDVPFQLTLIEPKDKIDNKSILKLCYSSSHKTRHMAVRLFYKKTF